MELTSATGQAGLAEEQAALRAIATLVAQQPSPEEVFTAVTEAVGSLLGADIAAMHVFAEDRTLTTVAGWSSDGEILPIGTRLPLDGDGLAERIFRSGAPARMDSYLGVEGATAHVARGLRLRSAVGAPIHVAGRLWGALMAATRSVEPLADDAEHRIAAFTELVATAIANADARQELERLAAEQAALRAIATLVAQQPSPEEVFTAVTEAVGRLLGGDLSAMIVYPHDGTAATAIAGWSAAGPMIEVGTRWLLDGDSVAARIFRTSASARMDTYDDVAGEAAEVARSFGLRSTVGAPIIVDGKLWGALMAARRGAEPLPETTEARMAAFTELVATAISNVEARDALTMSEARARELASEQAALRRIATLAARESSQVEALQAVVEEAARVLEVDAIGMLRFELDETATLVAQSQTPWDPPPLGTSFMLEGENVITRVHRSGRVARMDDWDSATGPVAAMATVLGITSAVAAPIVVEGRPWGTMVAATNRTKPLPPDTESRIAEFTKLLATAISSAENRAALARLADEQAALRRVATLVAAGVEPDELFSAVSEEVSLLFTADGSGVGRYEPNGSGVVTVGNSERLHGIPLGSRQDLDKSLIAGEVYRTGRATRIDLRHDDVGDAGSLGAMAQQVLALGFFSIVGAPIVVEGELWGLITASSSETSLPPNTEERIERFAELIATAIANAESRKAIRRLADEQAALRRVATLAAAGIEPGELFSAVSEEVARFFEADAAAVGRFQPDGSGVVVVGRSEGLRGIPVGTHADLDESPTVTEVYRTRRAARWTDKFYSSVAAPIVVGRNLWGVLTVGSGRNPLPSDTEERLEKFGELVATAIANAESRAALAASETRKSAILEWSLDCMVTIDHEGKIMEFNPAAEATFGYRREEVLGQMMAELIIPPSLREQHYRGLERYLKTSEDGPAMRKRIELKGMRSDGTEFPVELTVTPIPVADPPMFTAYMRDITNRKRSEEERAQLFRGERAARAEAETATRRAQYLAKEQAALRRVATLVAEGVAPAELFAAVADEVAVVLGVSSASVSRFLPDGVSLVLASLNDPGFPVGSRWQPGEGTLNATVLTTGRPVRIDQSAMAGPIADASRVSDVQSVVGAPIVVEGRVWGFVAVGRQHSDEQLPADTEARLTDFTELIATAISNTEARDSERRLGDEQAALRRVATLVAEGAKAEEVFSAVAEEVAGVIDIPVVGVNRYEADGTFTVRGAAGRTRFTVESRWPVEDEGVAGMILATGRPARRDDYSSMPGPLGEAVRQDLMVSTVGVPIVVDGSIWGFMIAAAKPGRPIPSDTEERLVRFTELIATAVSNTTTRTELLASRARVVSAADETRRRLERDLHDGIQQWLVALALKARKAARRSAAGESPVQELSGLADDIVAVTDELREISRGIHPAILTDAGLDDALEALARRSAVPVDLDVSFQGRYDPTLEATVYYLVAESITNAAKHAQASRVAVRGGLRGGAIELEVMDDGIGGADPRRGTGLIGLRDRVDTLGGTLSITSPAGTGTTVRVRLPTTTPADGDQLLHGSADAASAPASG